MCLGTFLDHTRSSRSSRHFPPIPSRCPTTPVEPACPSLGSLPGPPPVPQLMAEGTIRGLTASPLTPQFLLRTTSQRAGAVSQPRPGAGLRLHLIRALFTSHCPSAPHCPSGPVWTGEAQAPQLRHSQAFWADELGCGAPVASDPLAGGGSQCSLLGPALHGPRATLAAAGAACKLLSLQRPHREKAEQVSPSGVGGGWLTAARG